jgi:protein-L-isoaspartate(D-aspartate) O-methyltransferase
MTHPEYTSEERTGGHRLDDHEIDVSRRRAMVDQQLVARDIRDPLVLDAMWRVPRHLFVPDGLRDLAYSDEPLPIGCGQTISQPYIVALMTQLAQPLRTKRALDVGSGSGYQAAILAMVCQQVTSLELVGSLADAARARLRRLRFENVSVHVADGHEGWEECAPYDVIVVSAAPARVPPRLVEQLAVGGRLVVPIGVGIQELVVVERTEPGRVREWRVAPVRFVPMLGG